jgi:hypothetical protein
MTTLTKYLTKLSAEYGVARRPERYFDVPKRGELTAYQMRKVRTRFKELLERERCVKADKTDPSCYEKTTSDTKAKPKRGSRYKADYDVIYLEKRKDPSVRARFSKLKAKWEREYPLGLIQIAADTRLPIVALGAVFDIGVGAYATSGSRQGMSAEQWGYGRVYAFIMSYFHNDDDRYSNQRFLKNKTDAWVYEAILTQKASNKA